MLIDEFPRLGKLPFFTDALAYLAGYNIKVMLVMQSKAQLDAPDAHGVGNTVIESCKVRSVYTPQDPVTAQWISDALGPKTEVHQQTTYTGHRLAPWLGHVMVADQESSRPRLDAAEICKLTASDMILLVAGYPPIRARRFRYYEHPLFAARANLPALKLKPGGPYPFRPRQHPNPWAAKCSIVPSPEAHGAPAAAAPSAPKPDMPADRSEGSEQSRLVIPLQEKRRPEELAATPLDTAAVSQATIDEQLDLLISEEELMRRRALDELERMHHRRPHGVRQHIPL
jgi:type IV secretion system protein VirD4